jgi:hypothetical protein
MKVFISVILTVVGCVMSMYYIASGVRRWRDSPAWPSFLDMFKSLSFNESSGPQLVLEGVFGVVMTTLLAWLLFR